MTLASCVKEPFGPNSVLEEGEGWLSFSFGAENAIEVTTKATQDLQTESLIQNFYIFIFEQGGDPSSNDKVYGHFFDAENMTTESAFNSATDDCWYITCPNPANGTASGKVKLKASAGSGRTMYMLTNLDSDMVRISSDLLANTIKTEQDLLDFNVFLNQPIVYRNTHFPMSGKMTDVSIVSGTLNANESSMKLKRLDAKVQFVFKAGDRADARGQKIKSFEARKWKVVNVPRTAYVVDRGFDHGRVTTTELSNYSDEAIDFFDTDFVNFEKFTTEGTSEFSFYMPENRQTPKAAPASYQDRSRQMKDDIGANKSYTVDYVLDGKSYNRDMRLFEYANDFSTYVLVTGYVTMDLKDDSAGQVLGGEVQYLIHLGDWSRTAGASWDKDVYTGVANYNTERNTSYTYTVTINSVDNIRVEVETSKGSLSGVQEGQPGATGNLTIAKEEIALCDAHYVSKTLNFHLINFFDGGIVDEEHCVVDKMTWRVKTPFSEGGPQNIGGIDITEGLDYDWVRFRLNKQDAGGNYYADERRKFTPRVFESSTTLRSASDNLEGDGTPGLAGYHNDGSMDIVALVEYMRKQVKLWMQNPEGSDFDHKGATDDEIHNPDYDNPANDKSPKISVTVFVDEYYYTEHPLTHSTEEPTLWKRFVNADDRIMQILCNSDASKDLESRATGSVVTIQQKSIQSIFNTNLEYDALQTAWGLEITDEHESENWVYDNSTGKNTNKYNGLLNTCIEWTLANNQSSTTFDTGQKSWATFMNFEVNNDTPELNSGYQSLRYSCMTRNRDNNGNGQIERDEIRWYTGAVSQLMGLYMGDPVIDSDGKLYNRTPAQEGVESTWYQRVGTSTKYDGDYASSGDVYTIWSEEGISTGSSKWNQASDKARTVRCLRNIGHINGNHSETYSLGMMPEDYITVEEDPSENGSYIYTCTHLNENSLRYYSSKELPLADHRSVENRLYKKFKTAPGTKTSTTNNFLNFNTAVNNAMNNNEPNPYCPDGYRTPNQREMAIMKIYGQDLGYKDAGGNNLLATGYMTRTSWYFGPLGGKPVPISWDVVGGVNKNGFTIYWGNVSLQYNTTGNTTRCVKDIRTD